MFVAIGVGQLHCLLVGTVLAVDLFGRHGIGVWGFTLHTFQVADSAPDPTLESKQDHDEFRPDSDRWWSAVSVGNELAIDAVTSINRLGLNWPFFNPSVHDETPLKMVLLGNSREKDLSGQLLSGIVTSKNPIDLPFHWLRLTKSQRKNLSAQLLPGTMTSQAPTSGPWWPAAFRKRRDAALADYGDLTPFIEPQYGLIIRVRNMETNSNRSIDTTILRLKLALAEELPWSIENIHVEKINFAGRKIEFYFEDGLGRPVSVKEFLKDDLLKQLSKHVPDLGLCQLSEERNLAVSVATGGPFWTKSYFPYIVAMASVTVVSLIVLLIYCCCCRNTKGKAIADEEVVIGHTIYYPALKPELADPTPVQPDSPVPVFTTTGVTTPVPAQPIRIKAKGLLERRGSNASLTLDLNPSSDLGRWEGTPPKESTALEYLMSAGNRLSRRDLRNAVKHTKILYEEFWEIPMNHSEKVCVAGSGMKNRYKTIIPNEHSRVTLPDIDNDPLNSYINANYIRGYEGEPRAYIATQGPMAHTVVDFWRMIWAEKSPIIVMITKLKEKSKPKCENYLPERWGVYGDVEVVVDKMVCKKGYVVRHITLRCNAESLNVLHYWYTAWPDHKPPESPHMLLDLIKEVELRRYQSNDWSPRGPVCVHCSAGIGRTGCFIAISIGIRQLREEHSVDALGIVCAMRIDRGGMIQTHEQYDFVHQALAAYERELGESSVQSITALTSECVTTP